MTCAGVEVELEKANLRTRSTTNPRTHVSKGDILWCNQVAGGLRYCRNKRDVLYATFSLRNEYAIQLIIHGTCFFVIPVVLCAALTRLDREKLPMVPIQGKESIAC